MEQSEANTKTKRKNIDLRVRFNVFKRDGFSCRYCGAKPPEAVLQIDHAIPVSKGGSDDIDNLVTACSKCNMGKGSMCAYDYQEESKAAETPAKKRKAYITTGLVSNAMTNALGLVAAGESYRKAAAAAGVSLAGLVKALKRQREQT